MIKIEKGKKRVLLLYFILRFFVIAIMVLNIFEKNFNNVFVCLLTLALFLIPAIIDRRFNIKLPSVLEVIILLFIFAAQILGEIQGFYELVPFWDTILHTLNGFIMAAIGFAMIDILNQSPRLHFNMSPVFVAFVAFCFSMTIGVLWEFFEYFMDINFMTDMQKDTVISTISSFSLNNENLNEAFIVKDILNTNIQTSSATLNVNGYLDIGLIDTMHDMFVNCIGAVCFSIIGVLYIIGRGKFAKNFIPKIKTDEEMKISEKNYKELKKRFRKKRKTENEDKN